MADRTKTISFRIRTIDTDLTEAIAAISKDELAQKCRDGLRMIFGISTTRTARVQIIETPISISQPAPKPIQLQQKPSMWKPQTQSPKS
jgi:hypothetical protein